jgi:hypothetical protein
MPSPAFATAAVPATAVPAPGPATTAPSSAAPAAIQVPRLAAPAPAGPAFERVRLPPFVVRTLLREGGRPNGPYEPWDSDALPNALFGDGAEPLAGAGWWRPTPGRVFLLVPYSLDAGPAPELGIAIYSPAPDGVVPLARTRVPFDSYGGGDDFSIPPALSRDGSAVGFGFGVDLDSVRTCTLRLGATGPEASCGPLGVAERERLAP